MLSLDDRLRANPAAVTREAEGELVVVLPEHGKFVVLNRVGMRVVQLADGARSLRDIAALIAEEFCADMAQVAADVLKFSGTLCERQVLLPVAPPSS
ncbi:MAG TPA: PqqD family protein [Anaerolineae bacterium]|nr:PqqD family protein [Anaerolineae bacterium]